MTIPASDSISRGGASRFQPVMAQHREGGLQIHRMERHNLVPRASTNALIVLIRYRTRLTRLELAHGILISWTKASGVRVLVSVVCIPQILELPQMPALQSLRRILGMEYDALIFEVGLNETHHLDDCNIRDALLSFPASYLPPVKGHDLCTTLLRMFCE